MRMIKLFSRALLLLLILALAVYAGYYYQVKTSVDHQLQQMRPLVDARYDSLYVNPLGEISLNTVSLNLMGQPDAFIVDTVSLKSDPVFLLQFNDRVSQGDWPESLSLAVEGLNVDFSMPLFLVLEQLTQPVDGVQLAALGCGRINQFDMNALRMMGMRQGRFDFFLNLRSLASDKLNAQLLTLMHGWGEFALDLDLTGNLGLGNFPSLAPELQRMAVSFQDKGYNQRRNQFCAMQSGLPVDEYRQAHQSLVNDWVDQTAIPVPEELIEAYYQLGNTNSSLSFEFHTQGLDQEVISSPDQLFDQLSQNVTLSVNNQVQTFSAESLELMLALLQQPVMIETPSIIDESTDQSDELRGMPGVASPPVQPVPSIVPRRYQETAPENLSEYVGHPVRFFTSFGKRVEGILIEVEGSTARVAERVQHGTAQYPVEIDTIQASEVYR